MLNTKTETVQRKVKEDRRILNIGERLQTINGDYVTIKDKFIDDSFYPCVCYEVLENNFCYSYNDFEEYYNQKEVK